jgi:NADH:ubiquinone oxidoreductase subunit E
MSDRSQLISTGKPFQLTPKGMRNSSGWSSRYPTRESMILPALWLMQEQEGWISQEAIAYIADRIGTFASKVYEAATFYTMYHLHPMGRNHICICRTLSCWLGANRKSSIT